MSMLMMQTKMICPRCQSKSMFVTTWNENGYVEKTKDCSYCGYTCYEKNGTVIVEGAVEREDKQ